MDREVLQGILDRSPLSGDGREVAGPAYDAGLPWWLRQAELALATGLM
ncbi:hypothetical protein [Nocardioides sediminis]|nr:hypothetical protein [Nocardioides sediminis]